MLSVTVCSSAAARWPSAKCDEGVRDRQYVGIVGMQCMWRWHCVPRACATIAPPSFTTAAFIPVLRVISHSVLMTAIIPIETIRAIAARFSYEEIQWNETSRVISFRNDSDQQGNIRINVYYTTGTVATCLHHPYKGKTQLFRRNQTSDSLQAIFSNPSANSYRIWILLLDSNKTEWSTTCLEYWSSSRKWRATRKERMR